MAQRFQLKRSSIAGKRPSNEYLEPGEIALNTNARDAGVYFEANDKSILKAGPTYVGQFQPPSEVGYGHGETWLDTANGSLKVWNDDDSRWVSAVSPAQGGASTVIYVGSEYPEASDSVSNDGSARPFASLNRACLEVARRSILQNQPDDPYNSKFTIVLLPGDTVVYNEPGTTLEKFARTETIFQEGGEVTTQELRYFNSVRGSVPLPRGTSIVGLDMRKTRIVPTFYPYWVAGNSEEGALENPRTSIFSWTGNSFVSNVTFVDKKESALVTRIEGEADDVAVFHCLTSQSFRSYEVNENGESIADKVNIQYSDNVTTDYLGLASILPTQDLYVDPVSPTSFRLRDLSGKELLRNQFPAEPSPGSNPPLFFSIVKKLSTHHRLSILSYATEKDLNEYYEKVGMAFSATDFGVSENTYNVVDTETNIVGAVGPNYTTQINEALEAEAYLFNVSLRSNYGMSGLLVDGSKVGGIKEASASHFTAVSMQRDAGVFEVYYNQKWGSLRDTYATANGVQPENVLDDDAIAWMGEKVEIENIRYYYRNQQSTGSGSIGLPSDFTDTRHYMLKAVNGGIIKADNVTAIGTAVGCWSQGGGEILLSNSSTILGGQALRAEGFLGVGTAGGSLPPDRDFLIKGIRRPLSIPYVDIIDESNHKEFYLNVDLASASSTQLTFTSKVDIDSIKPFTLKPGTVIWVKEISTGTKHKATIAEDGLSKDGMSLAVESSGNSISSVNVDDLATPYVRRFIDPRPATHQNYALWVENSSQFHRPPSPSSVLRLAEKPGQGRTDILVYGRQFDPGENGGWNHVFSVIGTLSKKDGDNPNYTERNNVAPANDGNYYVSLRLCDGFAPWAQDTDQKYALGSFCSYEERAFFAGTNELQVGSTAPIPSGSESNWKSSKVGEYLDDAEEVYFGEGFEGNKDKNADKYDSTKKHSYPRGLTTTRENYESKRTIDWDNGEVDLGLGDSSKKFMSPSYSDPSYAASKMAMLRFMELMGYDETTIEELMQPQKWSKRNLPVRDIQDSPQNGYAVSRGEWPVEFNRSSIINATSHNWENAGYLDFLNGLPSYQTSVLSRRQRFDAMATEVWGGVVFVSGTNEAGKFILNSVNVVNASGRPTDEEV